MRRGRGTGAPRPTARNFLRAYAGGDARARPPARGEAAGSRVCGAASREVGGSAFVRSCPERPPPRLERARGGGEPGPGGPVLAPAARLQAGGVEGGTKGGGLFFCLCEFDNFSAPLHNADFQVSHSFYCYDYCHHLCVPLRFLSS